MSCNQRRTASSSRVLLLAAGLAVCAAPAFAADTTTTIPAGTIQTTAVTASPVSPDTYTLNILGTLRGANAGAVNNIIVQGTGSGPVVINDDGRMQGRLNFTGSSPMTLHVNTGADVLTGGWHTTGVTTLGSGNDLIDNREDGTIAATGATTFAFGAGTDSLVNAGRLITDRNPPGLAASTLTITGLETFENSGLILLGSKFSEAGDPGTQSDLRADDRILALGVAYTGSGDSRIAMDANLGAVTQASCAAPLTAADCIDFTGGSTAGSTLLTIRDSSLDANSAALNDGITLIVGSSAAEHFTLAPDSQFYAQTSSGPALQKSLVAYRLVYDDVGDRHMLVGTLADEAFQSATYAASAQETWRATTGTWLTRQADLRATPGGLSGANGLWARVGVSAADRDVDASYVQDGRTYDYDVSYSQRTSHLVFGADLLRMGSLDSAFVLGGMIGVVRSDVDYDAMPTEAVSSGFTGGLYASYVGGPLFVDAVLNLNLLDLRVDVPNMHLGADVPLKQDVKSLGGQIEAGWRFDTGGSLFVEPLAGLAYVNTRIGDIDVPGGGGTLDFEDKYTSFRAGGGLRLGWTSELLGVNAGYSLTGRYWSEQEGENASAAVVVGGTLSAPVTSTTPLMDDFSGGFGEVGGSINLYSDDGTVSGFLNVGGKFADDYRSVDAAVGVRLRW